MYPGGLYMATTDRYVHFLMKPWVRNSKSQVNDVPNTSRKTIFHINLRNYYFVYYLDFN